MYSIPSGRCTKTEEENVLLNEVARHTFSPVLLRVCRFQPEFCNGLLKGTVVSDFNAPTVDDEQPELPWLGSTVRTRTQPLRDLVRSVGEIASPPTIYMA